MFETDVNLVAVLACGLAAMVVGFLWYSKALFADSWMKLSGISMADIEKSKARMPVIYGTMFVGALVQAYVLAQLVHLVGALDITSGAIVGFFAWLGFVGPVMLSSVLFEGRPVKLYFINAGYQLVNMIIMGVILAMI
jgi:hypothetical protein